MYIYNHIHIWRAARNVKRPHANNYVGDANVHDDALVLQKEHVHKTQYVFGETLGLRMFSVNLASLNTMQGELTGVMATLWALATWRLAPLLF